MARKPEVEQTKKPEVDILGQLTVALDGTEYTLRPSRAAITIIERQLAKSLPQLAVAAGTMALSVEEMGIAVTELMRAHAKFDPDGASADYRGANPERCADLIYEAGPVEVARRLAVIFTGALAGGYTASGEVKAAGTKTTTEPTPPAA